MIKEKIINKWVKELDAALLTYDVEAFKAFYRKWEEIGLYRKPMPDNDLIIRASMEKALFNKINMPESEKRKAATWLVAHGFTTEL